LINRTSLTNPERRVFFCARSLAMLGAADPPNGHDRERSCRNGSYPYPKREESSAPIRLIRWVDHGGESLLFFKLEECPVWKQRAEHVNLALCLMLCWEHAGLIPGHETLAAAPIRTPPWLRRREVSVGVNPLNAHVLPEDVRGQRFPALVPEGCSLSGKSMRETNLMRGHVPRRALPVYCRHRRAQYGRAGSAASKRSCAGEQVHDCKAHQSVRPHVDSFRVSCPSVGHESIDDIPLAT